MNCGKLRRLRKFQGRAFGRSLVVPVDDALIAGPKNGLECIDEKLTDILSSNPDGLLCFSGFARIHASKLLTTPIILNLTASTTSMTHTRKAIIGSVESAMADGADAVAVHYNYSSKFEAEMLANLGCISDECHASGMPLLVIAYPRGEDADGFDDNYLGLRNSDPVAYTTLVSHAVRVAVELGADIVKTQFPGSSEGMAEVVRCAAGIPVWVAGGCGIPEDDAVEFARQAVRGGASGLSFGRNVFGRKKPSDILSRLAEVLNTETIVKTDE